MFLSDPVVCGGTVSLGWVNSAGCWRIGWSTHWPVRWSVRGCMAYGHPWRMKYPLNVVKLVRIENACLCVEGALSRLLNHCSAVPPKQDRTKGMRTESSHPVRMRIVSISLTKARCPMYGGLEESPLKMRSRGIDVSDGRPLGVNPVVDAMTETVVGLR